MLPITLVSQYKLGLKNPILEQRGKFWDKPIIFPDNTDTIQGRFQFFQDAYEP